MRIILHNFLQFSMYTHLSELKNNFYPIHWTHWFWQVFFRRPTHVFLYGQSFVIIGPVSKFTYGKTLIFIFYQMSLSLVCWITGFYIQNNFLASLLLYNFKSPVDCCYVKQENIFRIHLSGGYQVQFNAWL